jgi:hypothetical protein
VAEDLPLKIKDEDFVRVGDGPKLLCLSQIAAIVHYAECRLKDWDPDRFDQEIKDLRDIMIRIREKS